MMASRLRNDRSDLWTWAWQVSILALGYVAAGALGMQIANYREGVTLVWPASGLSLAALILFGRRLWPGIFIGTMLISLANLSTTVGAAVAIATGNTLESIVAVTLLVRVANFRPSLERMQDGIAFLLIGVLGCTTIGATIGTITYYGFGLVDADNAPLLWLIWWLGDLGGALVVTPMLLMLMHGTPSWTSLFWKIESWLALACLLVATLFAFFGPELGLMGFAASVLPVPVLVWAGSRLGPRGATTASFIMIAIATISTASGSGPFTQGTPTEAIFLLWSWAMLIGFTAFTLAAVVEQRNFADRQRRLEEIERLHSEKQKLLLLERERLTREMHDGLGGQIVSVLSMVERGLASRTEVAEAIRRAIDDIRIIIDSLDPATTDLPASLDRLRARLEPLLRRNGIVLSWNLDADIHAELLSPHDVLHVLRIIQEAVTNVLKHANASAIRIEISLGTEQREQLHVSVDDDGGGLPPDWATGGRGTQNMKSRAQELGAELRIEDSNSGTRVDLVVPLAS